MIPTDAKDWKKYRSGYMRAARECLNALLNQGRSRDEARVQQALQFWVSRARRSHAIAMGREPIIPNLVVISNEGGGSFPLYAKQEQGQ